MKPNIAMKSPFGAVMEKSSDGFASRRRTTIFEGPSHKNLYRSDWIRRNPKIRKIT